MRLNKNASATRHKPKSKDLKSDQGAKSAHGQRCNNLTADLSIDNGSQSTVEKYLPSGGDRITVISELCPWKHFEDQEDKRKHVYRLKKREFTTTDLF